jgi:EmrB/QacA subfamily drug resistance transporter
MSARQRSVFAIASLGFFVVQLDLFIVNIAFPAIGHDFTGSSLAQLSWVLDGYAIVYASLLVAAGRLADLLGRRRVFLAGLGLFTASSALCALTPSANALIAARLLQAAGAALVTPASLGLLLSEFPTDERAKAIAGWVAVGGVAAASGPTLGGLLTAVSWRLVFLVNVPVGVAGIFYGLRLLRESRDETATGLPDLAGAAMLSLATAAVVLGLVQAPSWHWASIRELLCFSVAGILVALFIVRSASHPRPVIELRLLRVRSFSFAGLATTLYMTAFAASLLASVLFLTTVWHESALVAGVEITPGPVLVATISPLAGRLAGRVGQRYLIALGCVLFAGGCAWWGWQMTPHAHYLRSYLPGWIACGTGVGFALPSLMSAGAGSLPSTRFATGSAVLTMCRQLGAALGVSLLILTLGHSGGGDPMHGFDRAWLFTAATSILAACAGLAVGTVHPPSPEPAEPSCLGRSVALLRPAGRLTK